MFGTVLAQCGGVTAVSRQQQPCLTGKISHLHNFRVAPILIPSRQPRKSEKRKIEFVSRDV